MAKKVRNRKSHEGNADPMKRSPDRAVLMASVRIQGKQEGERKKRQNESNQNV